jgi:hypothetical protein
MTIKCPARLILLRFPLPLAIHEAHSYYDCAMKKYSALSHHLSEVNADTAELTFSEVEEIIGGPLPGSANRHNAWWANEKDGTHSWAHLWRAAGWLRDQVDFERRIVTFRRTTSAVKDILDDLRPRTNETIFDLLQQAAISTDAWFTKANGDAVSKVKANPNFCYDWSFGSPREGYALCIWHGTLGTRDDHIVFNENLRDLAERLQADGRDRNNDAERRTRAATQAARARAFDDALNVSYARGLPVSVILTEGDKRDREELGEGSSHVQYRSLDPIKWYVHEYDEGSGAALLLRGVKPDGVAQNSREAENEESGPPDDVQRRAIKVRRGQAQFREKLLAAYGRTCAITGCKIVELLEAAHIRPHADEPNYSVTNGLLLRADVHTLYDLDLLSVDTRLRIRLAPALLHSEYKNFDGRDLRQPSYPSEMPNLDAVDRRYRAFKEKHGL